MAPKKPRQPHRKIYTYPKLISDLRYHRNKVEALKKMDLEESHKVLSRRAKEGLDITNKANVDMKTWLKGVVLGGAAEAWKEKVLRGEPWGKAAAETGTMLATLFTAAVVANGVSFYYGKTKHRKNMKNLKEIIMKAPWLAWSAAKALKSAPRGEASADLIMRWQKEADVNVGDLINRLNSRKITPAMAGLLAARLPAEDRDTLMAHVDEKTGEIIRKKIARELGGRGRMILTAGSVALDGLASQILAGKYAPFPTYDAVLAMGPFGRRCFFKVLYASDAAAAKAFEAKYKKAAPLRKKWLKEQKGK